MTRLYQLYIRIKYKLWKYYWRIFPPKGHPKTWKEIPIDLVNPDAVAIGIIYSGGPWGPATKVIFNNKDYGVVGVKTYKS